MINKTQIDKIKLHLKDYLEETGRSTKNLFNCVNPQHEDNNPSMKYNDKDGNYIKCFSCNTTYDLISLYALDHNLDSKTDFRQILEELALKYNEDIKITSSDETPKQDYSKVVVREDYTKYINKCKKNISKTNYLQTRGISDKLVAKYNIGYDEKEKRVIFPLSTNNYIGRNTDNTTFKHYKPKGSTNELFNGAYLKDSNFKSVVWITEAIIDALSLEEANEDIKAISLNSINNAKQLVSEAKASNFKGLFILALDTDTQGIRASKELQEDLELIGIKAILFNRDSDKYNITIDGNEVKNKDINEYLVSDKNKLTNDITSLNDMAISMLEQQAKKTYEQENALNYLDTFKRNIQDQAKNQALSTGIKSLDEAIGDGFFKKQLVILGAISSLGKTTLALQLADNIARQGEEVLIFSLEMAKDELIAKSLSRLSFLKAYDRHYTALALNTKEVMTGKGFNNLIPNNEQRIEVFNEALEDYKTIANNIYISELNEDNNINIKTIEEKIKRHIAITNKKPFVVIDYLQIIQDNDKYLNDKQRIDKILTDLKRLARDNDITILLISSLNRGAYTQEISLDSFKDSGNIEYTADLLLGLQAEISENINDIKVDKKAKEIINKVQQKDERSLILKVLKNRNGKITDLKGIKFYAKYNYMYFSDNTNNY